LVWAELDDQGCTPRICCPDRKHTVAGEAGWLYEQAHTIMELHPDFYREIELLHSELRKACRVRREYVPTCPACATATRRNRVEAIYGDDPDSPAWWRCTACEKTWVADAEVRRFALTQPKMKLREIASWLSIPYSTLQRWRTLKYFTTDSRGYVEVEHVRRAADNFGRVA
jgi:transposase-like protein